MKSVNNNETVYSRRRFLKNLGGGVVVVFCLGEMSFSYLFAQEGQPHRRTRF